MTNLQEFKQLILKPSDIVIVTHFMPDADALGSSLGWCGYLKKKGHRVTVITPNPFPESLAWMSESGDIVSVPPNADVPQWEVKALIENADIIFCIDFCQLGRINTLGPFVKKSSAERVIIDHHLEPEKLGRFQQWDPDSASASGLVFELISALGDQHFIDHNIANCLYAGLLRDTEGFRHANVRQREFLIASELVSLGANTSQVSTLLYNDNSIEKLRLSGYLLSEKLFVVSEFRTVYMTLTADEFERYGAQSGDTEGLVNYGLSIRGIKLSVFLHERKDEIKFSFRSFDDFSVSDLAKKHFHGGGHKNAAGGSLAVSLDEALKKLLLTLPEYKDTLQCP